MELDTVKLGKIQIGEDNRYTLPLGLPGFPDEKRFALIKTENVHPFVWFQSEKTDWLAFLLCDPRLFHPEFSLQIDRESLTELEIEDVADTSVYVIVTVPENPQEMTANMQGPLVFNLKNRRVIQTIHEGAELRYAVFSNTAPV